MAFQFIRFVINEIKLKVPGYGKLSSPTVNILPLDNGIWKMVWGPPVSSKVRNFLLFACQDAIPVKQSLWKRKILIDNDGDTL